MIKEAKIRKPKAGLLLVASPRFKNLSGPKRGTYGEKKEAVSRQIVESLNFIDIEYPGIVYEREDAQRAMDLFYNAKVDFIIAEFLSWSEDFAWIRFLRDCPDIPVIFVNVAKDRMAFETTLVRTISWYISAHARLWALFRRRVRLSEYRGRM